jgi:hypothetical protein
MHLRQRVARLARLRSRAMRTAGVIVALASAWALAGCGASPRQEVEAKVQQFAHATAAKDYATLCDKVLAPSPVTHLVAAGLTCDRAMMVFVSSVHDPTIQISRVAVYGASASVEVLARATGQPSSRERIDLVKTPHGWRLASLASPR